MNWVLYKFPEPVINNNHLAHNVITTLPLPRYYLFFSDKTFLPTTKLERCFPKLEIIFKMEVVEVMQQLFC